MVVVKENKNWEVVSISRKKKHNLLVTNGFLLQS